ncbi:phosphatase PAP2 family protein [Marinilabiliaceae bacterium JC017]|nr:phosphatase PAP2 family protein [Marinilabiliaceae bacterium JC017]
MKRVISLVMVLVIMPGLVSAENYSSQFVKEVCNLRLKRRTSGSLVKEQIYCRDKVYLTVLPTLVSKDENLSSPWYKSKAARISYVPGALFALGAYSWQHREDIRMARNRYMPTYRSHFDDYLQYTPALAVYGLNLCGVKGKHSLGRATTSYALAALFTVGVVNSMKYSIKERRPDNTSRNSFPSGHTANAFMNATFFHKEFGQYRSPLYSFFGYAVASWTGIMRQLNNRHWMPDVLVGAGIGILVTELAYTITDHKYGDRGLNTLSVASGRDFEQRNPSFINVKVGFASADGDLIENSEDIYAQRGFSSGLEGAYFFNRWLGLGGQMLITSFPINSNNLQLDPEAENFISALKTQAMGASYYMAGPYFHLGLGNKFSVMMHVTAGRSMGASGAIMAQLTPEGRKLVNAKQIPIMQYEPMDAFAWSPGAQICKRLNDRIALGIYGHYLYNCPQMNFYDVTGYDPETKKVIRTYTESSDFDFSHWSAGITINALL